MPASFTYPGVYITEKPSGAQAVPAAATSIALFIGMADQGPFGSPTRVQGLPDFVKRFGQTSAGEMADQVGQFFMNGGGDSYVMRIANGAQPAAIDLQSEVGTAVLTLTARDKGASGNLIRVEVDYATAAPGRTFNLTAYRSTMKADGTFARTDAETIPNLTLNPGDPRFVETIVAAQSQLVTAKSKGVAPLAAGGTSIGGILYHATVGGAQADLLATLTSTGNSFSVSVAGRPPVTAVIDKTGITAANVVSRIQDAIITGYQQQLANLTGKITVALNALTPAALGRVLEITSTEGAVVITTAATSDCATVLMLGVAAGGIEIDQYSPLRPAQSGIFSSLGTAAGAPTSGWLGKLLDLANQARQDVGFFEIADPGVATPYKAPITIAGTVTDPLAFGAATPNALGTFSHLRDALDSIAASINAATGTRWTAKRQGFRLVLSPAQTLAATATLGVNITTSKTSAGGDGYDLGAVGKYWDRAQAKNIGAYTLGSAPGGREATPVLGLDGTKPLIGDYQAAFGVISSSVEIFNMLVLPRAPDQTDADRRNIWGAASNFAAASRAILFVDPDAAWTTIDLAEPGADAIKAGVDTRNSVIYWPKLKVPDATGGPTKIVDPSGSMAGLYARTDTRFGTWRAPAGIEATLTGTLGPSVPMSDGDNGRINPKALNAIRLFPSGITAWGARTMVGADDTGNVDDKYINVRRMMLFIENSLYRGLRFATFKNNAEPLWASIRLAAGSFMNGLMVQGAFASKTKSDAYYVLCDSTTTSANDINLGIVNVLVGFAPNKPAEFVNLTVTQIAGQIEA